MTNEIDSPEATAGTHVKAVIITGLDKSLAALEDSFVGLADEQFWAFPLPRRNNIVTLVEHCIQILDMYACELQGEALTFEPEKRFDTFHFSPQDLRPLMHDLPTVELERRRIAQLRQHITAGLQCVIDADLIRPRRGCWWFDENPGRVRSDAYMDCVWHTTAHVRQIWLMRGLMGVRDDQGWPQ